MDDIEVVLEKLEAFDHANGDPAEDTFRNTNTLKFVKAASVHTLHTIIDTGLDEECAVEFDDFWGDGLVKNLKLHHDSVEFGLVKLKSDFLRGSPEMDEVTRRTRRTFIAIYTLVGTWRTFLTVP